MRWLHFIGTANFLLATAAVYYSIAYKGSVETYGIMCLIIGLECFRNKPEPKQERTQQNKEVVEDWVMQ